MSEGDQPETSAEAPAPAGASGVPEGAGAPGAPEDIEVSILPDGRVQLHARCRPGEDPSACALRVKAFVDALGVPEEAVVQRIDEEGEDEAGSAEEPGAGD